MVQAQATGSHNVIDLTGEEDDEQIQILSTAASNAQVAATRFKALTAPSSRNSFIGNTLDAAKNPLPQKITALTVSQSRDALQKQLPSADTKVRPRSTHPKSTEPFCEDQSVRLNDNLQNGLPEKSKDDKDVSTPSLRSPRAAAQAAGRVIAETYEILNPLEVNRESTLNSPKKPARPKMDHWMPKSHSSHRPATNGKHDKDSRSCSATLVAQITDTSASDQIDGFSMSRSTSEQKRKRHESSPESDPLQKHAKSNNALDDRVRYSNQEPRSPSPAKLPLSLDRSRSSQQNKVTSAALGEKPWSCSKSAMTGGSKPWPPRRTEMSCLYQSLEQIQATAAAGTQKAVSPSHSTDTQTLSKVFEDLVYPALRKAKNHHEGKLPEDDLISISKKVATEVVDEKLKGFPLSNLLRLTHHQRKDMKRFIKTAYQEKVLSSSEGRSAEPITSGEQPRQLQPASRNSNKITSVREQDNTRSPASRPAVSASGPVPPSIKLQEAQPTAQPTKITNLSEYIRKLENESLPTDPDIFETSPKKGQTVQPSSRRSDSPAWVTSVDQIFCDSLNDHADNIHLSPSFIIPDATTAQAGLEPSTESSFPPGFDRGRYPAQRRRRGNKYYTPVRPSKTTPSDQTKSQVTPTQQHPAQRPKPASLMGTSRSDPSQKASETIVSQSLIERVKIDKGLRALFAEVASGKASLVRCNAFQELIDEHSELNDSGVSPQSFSQAIELEDDCEYSRSASSSIHTSESQLGHTSRMGIDLAAHPEHSTDIPRERRREGQRATASSQGYHREAQLQQIASSIMQPEALDQPTVTRILATVSDPQLERHVADLVLNEPERPLPENKPYQHFIDYSEREKLLQQPTLLKHASRGSGPREQKHSNSQKPSFTRIETKVIDPVWRPERHVASLLRHRELGSDTRGRNVNTHRELRLRNAEQIEPWRYWKGASGDIVAAAWGPDSTTYAVGAAAHTNSEDLQYNRPCNLLLGDLVRNSLAELPDHRVDRPKPETLIDTYNARQAVYDACDPMVYETVSSITFSPSMNRMYTASHDRTVKIWDTSATREKCLRTLHHNAHVTSVEASAHIPGLFATASDVIDDSVRVYYAANLEDSNPLHVGFSSSRAQARRDWKIYPECIRWGSTSYTSHLLLAGFRQWEYDDDEAPREGQLCLWDANAFQFIKVIPSSQGILAAAWHPTLPFFATGGAPGGNSLTDKYTTKTVVRTWDLRSPKHYTMEYECSALDMQDITFHPADSNIVTAGCTDGTSFVWDYRRPDYPLHRLKHGHPLVGWDHTRGQREEVDTGIMMSLWGLGGSLFYTGSSDGMIKAWDVRRHPQDVLVRNVAQFSAGIQSGAISPDGTNLLAGDADGGVHVLSSAPCGQRPSEEGSVDVSPELPITLVRALDGSGMVLEPDDDNLGTEGRDAAEDFIGSMQLEYDTELGVTQGSMYSGPYATYWREQAQDPCVPFLSTQKSAGDKQSFLRTPQEHEEIEKRRRGLIRARKQRIAQLYRPPDIGQQPEVKQISQNPKNPLSDRSTLHVSTNHVSPHIDAKDWKIEFSTSTHQSRPYQHPNFLNCAPKSQPVSNNNGSPEPFKFSKPPIFDNVDSAMEHAISESEMVEENHWWPDLGALEIERAKAGRGHENFPE